MNIIARKSDDFDLLEIHGRIDGITASEIKRTFDQAASEGIRTLVADFGNVSYMSSAGLRIILQTHKSFLMIGGQLILVSVPAAVSEVFRISGIDKFLTVYNDFSALQDHFRPRNRTQSIETVEAEGIRFSRLHKGGAAGKIFPIGSAGKLSSAEYHRYDVVRILQSDLKYGAGLAALGDEYGDFHMLFGESVSVGRHFFSYPAVPHPSVDYSFFSADSRYSLNFLHGFGFSGEFHEILHFDTHRETPTLETLMQAAAQVTGTGMFGAVILAVSGGILGMHLKKSPVIENKPAEGDILAMDSFSEWMSYPLEEEDIHKTIVAAGIFAMSAGEISPLQKEILPEESPMHFHAAVFENGLWSVDPGEFETELDRVLRDFEVDKVVHLLPASRLKSGYIGIINLENL